MCVHLPVVAAAIVRRRLHRGKTVIAVSGSRGKTTANELLAEILSARFRTVRSPGGSNGRFGVPRTILAIEAATQVAVVEVGVDGPGIMWRAAAVVQPDVVVLTSVAREHAENFPTLEATAREKERLVSSLKPTGVAILNKDDRRVSAMADRARTRVVTYGQTAGADLRAGSVRATWPERLSFDVTWNRTSCHVATRLVGEHWVTSVLAALAASLECGSTLEEAVGVVSRFEPFPARLQPVALACGATMLRDEYNGSMGTLAAALRVMQDARAARKITVLSDFTDDPRSAGERLRDIGRSVGQFADMAVFVGDHAEFGVAGALEAGAGGCQAAAFGAVSECAAFLREQLREGDLVLLKGRNADHLSRIYWELVEGPVACKKTACPQRILCDECPELGGQSLARQYGTLPHVRSLTQPTSAASID